MVFVLRRIGVLAVGSFAILVVAFLIVRLIPGDPVQQIAGLTATQEYRDRLREQLGLNDPLPVQFWNYLTGILQGDFGTGFRGGQEVSTIIAQRMPASLGLAALALVTTIVLALVAGLTVGTLTARGRRSWLEAVFGTITGVLTSIPGFLLGVGLVALFGVALQWLPTAGMRTPLHFILPTLSLAIPASAVLARLVRVQTSRILEEDFVRTARSKRLPQPYILAVQVVPHQLTALLTLGGTLFPALIGGAVIVEVIFNWPGLGTELVASVLNKDYPVVQGIVLVLGVVALTTTTVVDVLIALIDPRTKIAED